MNDKDKKKCLKIIKKIFGIIFYFVHGTTESQILKILEDSKIKTSNKVPESEHNFGGNKYAYCWGKLDDIQLKSDNTRFNISMFISPMILLEEDVSFNTMWFGTPIKESNIDINLFIKTYDKENFFIPTGERFGIHLKKDDSLKIRIKKLKIIKKYLMLSYKREKQIFYSNSHEFLFENDINLKYLIGCLYFEDNYDITDYLNNHYKNVKQFHIKQNEPMPNLIDMCP